MKSIIVNFLNSLTKLSIQVSYKFLTISNLPLLQTDQRLFLKLNLRKFFFHRDFFFCENSTSATLPFTNVHTQWHLTRKIICEYSEFKSGSNFHFSDDGKFVLILILYHQKTQTYYTIHKKTLILLFLSFGNVWTKHDWNSFSLKAAKNSGNIFRNLKEIEWTII